MEVLFSPNRREIVILTMASFGLALIAIALTDYLESFNLMQGFYSQSDDRLLGKIILQGPGKFAILGFILAIVSVLKSIRGLTFGRFYSRLTMVISIIAICLAILFPIVINITLSSLF